MDDHLRLSDNERISAMSALATHFTEGRLDTSEFDERTLAASQAKTRGDLRPLFDDLPGQLPAALSPQGSTALVDKQDAELAEIRSRGMKVEKWDGVLGSVTLASFFILMFAFDVSWAWIVWPIMGALFVVIRLLNHFSDSDEKVYEEMKEVEEKARKARIERATERLRELEGE
ncbi:MAG TPA: DUF1707 domain-containing protein [Corynebacterium pollutisoli]|uniref:DUF1707 domain-containing protein n=1 Tax=Corynebacterium pollutisoli TaxID=1610489 RepID=A0A7X8MUR0_9CORY|nr:DUF1707 domain-containing protein [Corynebacterium pollutisoli]HJD79707.1 DUF1707 domain-containing protein [Corynebacterium pollutisoli]